MRYQVFLSYSHSDNRSARWLMRRLETYRVPQKLVGTSGRYGPIGVRLGPVFRDRDELSSASDLSVTIKAALDESAALVVLCSPAAARSRWVNAEVAAFRASGRGDRIQCFVVDGDPSGRNPDRACFPPALLDRDPDGTARGEPLAADARRAGDGRQRAFLKLVAGLLGISYDSLAPREAQRRARRLALITAASLSGTAVALVLAAAAFVARNDAQRRQAQAEDILDFMIGDLRKKLTGVGRLDLMRAVDDKASDYFATLDPRDLSDRTLEAQARSLNGIGQVRLSEGNYESATGAFREALTRTTALAERQPKNGQRLFDLAQAQYWVGLVALEQGSVDVAGIWFRKYNDSAVQLAAMDRSNFDWQREVAWGQHNLAVVDERLGRYAQAEQEMRHKRELYRDWLLQRPDDLTLRYEDASAASWLGSIAERQGKLADAEDFFTEQFDAMHRNAAEEPTNAQWEELQVDALILLVGAQASRGRLVEARASLATATALAEGLARRDPSNMVWQVEPGVCRWWKAQMATVEREPSAEDDAAAATMILERSYEVEPRNERVVRWLAKALGLQARHALAEDDVAIAEAHLRKALALLGPAWGAHRNEALRLVLADTWVLSGEVAQAHGDRDRAMRDWTRAEQLLEEDAGTTIPFQRLDPLVRVLRYLGRRQTADTFEQTLAAAGYVPVQPFPDSAPHRQ